MHAATRNHLIYQIFKQCESNKSYLKSIIMKLSSSMLYGDFDIEIYSFGIDFKKYRMIKEKHANNSFATLRLNQEGADANKWEAGFNHGILSSIMEKSWNNHGILNLNLCGNPANTSIVNNCFVI